MKPYLIIIIFSLFYGLTSVYAQQTNTDVKKSEQEAKTKLQNPDIRRSNQPHLPGELLKKATTSGELKSPEEQRALYGPRANEPDPSRKAIPSKTRLASDSETESNTRKPRANENPNKSN